MDSSLGSSGIAAKVDFDQLYAFVFNQSKDLICVTNFEGNFITANPTFVETLEYSLDELLSVKFIKLVHPEDLEKTTTEFEQIINSNDSTLMFQNRHITKSGKIVQLEWNSTIDYENKRIYSIARNISIENRKEIEKSLDKKLIDATKLTGKIGTWVFSVVEKSVTWSDETYQIFEIDKGTKNLYGDYLSRFNENDLKVFNYHTVKALNEGKPYTFQHDVNLPDNRVKHVFCAGVPTFNGKNEVISIEGIVSDITEEYKIRETIERNEKLMSVAQSIAKLGSWRYDFSTGQMTWSPEVYNIFGISQQSKTPLFEEFQQRLTEASQLQWREISRDAIKKGSSYTQEYRIVLPHGEEKYIKEAGVPTLRKNGRTMIFEGVVQDITEIVKSRETIIKNIEEKEVLIKEVHHRVKNNLQVIASLLNLQSSLIEDTEIKAIFQDSKSRIDSMAAIHNLLYLDDSLPGIKLDEYLELLSRDLMNTYFGGSDQVGIELKIAPEVFDLDRAVPLGLFINEVISNSFKHAFPKNANGKVIVKSQQLNPKTHRLEITDNGIGFDLKAIEEGNTLGMMLIKELSEQLDGHLTIKSDSNGSCITLDIPHDQTTI